MKQIITPALALLLIGFTITSCNKPTTPKDVSAEFIRNLYSMNFDDASELSTDATKAIIQANKKSLQEQGVLEAESVKRTEEGAEAAFSTKTLKVKTSGNEADASNDAVSVHLKLEDGKWKVAADNSVVEAILYRETYLENAKMAWAQLKDAYDKRTAIVKDYISYRQSTGITKETQSISGALNSIVSDSDPVAFVRSQDNLSKFLDQNITPSYTAGSDIALNFIVQLATARDNIIAAKKAYNAASAKARNKMYPPVTEK